MDLPLSSASWVIVEIAFMVAVRSYYYQSVETALGNRAETYRNSVSLTAAFSNLSAGTADLSQRSQELVERFNNKEKMELQVLDKTGSVLISSTGFVPAPDLNMEDFKRALQAGSGDRGVWTGKTPTGKTSWRIPCWSGIRAAT